MKYQKQERTLNIILALTSSASVAAWAIWQMYPLLWSLIIAISQVISVAKPYFPFSKYVRELNSKSVVLENFVIEFERLWSKMQTKRISEDSAEETHFEMKKQAIKLLEFSEDTIVNASEKMIAKGNEQMKNYLWTNYKIEIKTK